MRRQLILSAALVGGFTSPAYPNVSMMGGEGGKANIVYDGYIEYTITNPSDEDRKYRIVVREKDGVFLKRHEEFRTEAETFQVNAKNRETIRVRFKPGSEERRLYICAEEHTDEPTSYVSRVCSRAVVFMGRAE